MKYYVYKAPRASYLLIYVITMNIVALSFIFASYFLFIRLYLLPLSFLYLYIKIRFSSLLISIYMWNELYFVLDFFVDIAGYRCAVWHILSGLIINLATVCDLGDPSFLTILVIWPIFFLWFFYVNSVAVKLRISLHQSI